MTGATAILILKIAVAAVSVVLLASIVALFAKRFRLHGQLNLVFMILTFVAVFGLEFLIRIYDPNMFAYFDESTHRIMTVHLSFSIPAALLLPIMYFTGRTGRSRLHYALAAVFSICWIGTFITGIFYLPHFRAMTNYAVRLQDAQAEAGNDRADRSPPPLLRIIEALLFAGRQPLTAEKACSIARDLTPELFEKTVDELAHHYRNQARPYEVQQRDGGFVLALKPAYHRLRERIFGGPREVRLSVIALEVLAVVAYKQPVTRKEVDSIRGADSATTLRQLVRLGLIAVERPIPGSAEPTYGTTPRFLAVFNLNSLDDLPKISDLQKI